MKLLERIEITPLELKIADELKGEYFGVESNFHKQIIEFFKTHDCNYEYFVTQSEDVNFRNIYIGDDEVYRKYHINLSLNNTILENERYRVLIITEEQFKLPKNEFVEFTRELINPQTTHPLVKVPFVQNNEITDKIGICVIEMHPEEQYNYIASLKDMGIDTSYYDEFYSEFKVINRSRAVITQEDLLVEILKENLDMQGKELLNFVSLCEQNEVVGLEDSDLSLAKVKDLVNLLIERNKSSANGIALYYNDTHLAPGTVNYVIRQNSSLYKNKLYCLCALYLKIYEDIPCYIDDFTNEAWETMSRYINSRDNNYVEDYLEFLANPTEVGFTVKQGYNYYLYRKTNIKRYNLTFTATKVVMNDFSYTLEELEQLGIDVNMDADYYSNLKTLRLFDEKISNFVVSRNQIKIIPIRDIYRINTYNFKFSHKELKRLNRLIWQLTRLVKDTFIDTALDCSNLVLFELQGELYLGALHSVDYKCEYQCIPVSTPYRNTKYSTEIIELTAAEMGALLDVRLFSDYKILIGNTNLNSLDMFKHTFMAQLVNFLFNSSNKTITGLSGLAYDEATILYQITKDLRGSKARILTKGGLTIANLKYSFLTYFGGPTAYERHTNNNTDSRIELELTKEMFQ